MGHIAYVPNLVNLSGHCFRPFLAAMLTAMLSPVAGAQTFQWATIDGTGPIPKIEAGSLPATTVSGSQGRYEFKRDQPASGIVVTCFEDGGLLDAGECSATVVRDLKDLRHFAVYTHGYLGQPRIKAKFTILIFSGPR